MSTPSGMPGSKRAGALPTAIVTASYRGDFERCRLLCESIDTRVSGHTRHLILVEGADVPLFRQLAGPRREIVDERDVLPWWLRAFPDPTNFGRRRIWLQPKGPPLRGWHVQQLRRFAVAASIDETVMVNVDSDVVFFRPFAVADLVDEGRVRFYRVPAEHHEILPHLRDEHAAWSRKAGELLGITAPRETSVGYIATVIAWRTDTARDMARRIEAVTGRSYLAALAATRTLSECTIYGRFVDEVEGRPDRHLASPDRLCRIYWAGEALDAAALDRFVDALEPGQVAAGIQSFTRTDPALIRRAAGLA
nr:DUF6492 family protein [Mangrovicella endophytica]